MCDHGDTVPVTFVGGTRAHPIDRCLLPIINALNGDGIPTTASCCGHGQQPGSVALKDGRVLVIMPTLEEGNRIVGENRYHENGPFAPVEQEAGK